MPTPSIVLPSVNSQAGPSGWPAKSVRHNEQLLLTALLSEAAGSLRSPAALFMIAPQQNCGRWAD